MFEFICEKNLNMRFSFRCLCISGAAAVDKLLSLSGEGYTEVQEQSPVSESQIQENTLSQWVSILCKLELS